jgi:hypothetical protein
VSQALERQGPPAVSYFPSRGCVGQGGRRLRDDRLGPAERAAATDRFGKAVVWVAFPGQRPH